MKQRNYVLWKRFRVVEGELDQQSGPRKGREGGRGDEKSSGYAKTQQGVRRVKSKQEGVRFHKWRRIRNWIAACVRRGGRTQGRIKGAGCGNQGRRRQVRIDGMKTGMWHGG